MGEYLSTDITSPHVVAVGGVITGGLTVTPPAAGDYYLLMEQYSAELAFIPGSRAFLYRALVGGNYVNNTFRHTNQHRVATGVAEDITVELTVPNTDCFLHMFLKRRASRVTAGAFVVGTEYEIMSIGTTDFTLIGAASNTVGVEFVATGVGVGTGTAAVPPAPETDEEVDYVAVTLLSAAPAVVDGIDFSSMMNLMITMMIVVMMMKMMTGAMSSVTS